MTKQRTALTRPISVTITTPEGRQRRMAGGHQLRRPAEQRQRSHFRDRRLAQRSAGPSSRRPTRRPRLRRSLTLREPAQLIGASGRNYGSFGESGTERVSAGDGAGMNIRGDV